MWRRRWPEGLALLEELARVAVAARAFLYVEGETRPGKLWGDGMDARLSWGKCGVVFWLRAGD